MQLSDLDLDNRTIHVPLTKTGKPTKSASDQGPYCPDDSDIMTGPRDETHDTDEVGGWIPSTPTDLTSTQSETRRPSETVGTCRATSPVVITTGTWWSRRRRDQGAGHPIEPFEI